MERKFKYHNELIEVAKFRKCPFPPENLRAPDFTEDVFRFVFEEKNHPNNFLPPFKIQPVRAHKIDDKQKTDGYALSFFEQEKAAKDFFYSIIKKFKNFPKSKGNSIAKGLLSKQDGLVDLTDKDNHFNLYEYDSCDLVPRFTFMEKLIK